jgi:rhamnulokinase
VQYRDHRTDGLLEAARDVMPHETIYEKTGIAFLQFNTLYQLWALARSKSEVLRSAKTFLMMPDLVHYCLCGVAACEYTNASTTQLIGALSREWDPVLFEAFGLPRDIMPDIVPPGTVLGPLDADIAHAAGLNAPKVITPCTHDTASAVLAVPTTSTDSVYISCGTWSLMGAELDSPLTTPQAWAHNFTNEGGYANTIRFLKNIMGLWVFQQARASWAQRGQEFSYAELVAMAEEAPPFSVVLNIDDPIFFNPDDMLDAIDAHCRATGQTPPTDVATTARGILEGLALRYAVTLHELETVTGRAFSRIHLVGGGTQNSLLCQLASDATGRPLVAGPTEATALGNIVTQAIATGALPDHHAGRALIARVTDTQTYEPKTPETWEPLRERFCKD